MDSDINNETPESIESKRREAHCCLCGAEGFDIVMTDGRVLHTDCYETLKEKESDLHNQVDACSYQIDTFSHQFRVVQEESQSFIGSISQFFGARDFQKELQALMLKDPRQTLEKKKREANFDLMGVQRSLVDLYNYWPDYPPDWEERRDRAKSSSRHECVACGSEKWLHVHHKFSLQRGGSNLPDNLEVLCSDCHGKEHNFDFKSGESRDIKGYGDKKSLIKEAMSKGRKISFLYRKFGEDQSNKRTILPKDFVQIESRDKTRFNLCIKGHCDLRHADRIFNLRKMSKLRVLEK